jgi:hypothetical protein
MVRVWRGEKDWVFGWHSELNERGHLGSVDRSLNTFVDWRVGVR